MGYMKRNLNFGLLALVLGMIMVFIGFTLYYQQTFNNLALNYTTKLSQLEKVTQDLSKHKAVLTETKYELNKTTEDVEAISFDYEEMVQEKGRVQGELDSTTSKLNTKITELSDEKKLVRDLNIVIKAKETEITKYKNLYEDAEDKYNECKDDLEDCDDNLDDCRSDLAACTAP